MSEHLPTELSYLLTNTEFNIVSDDTVLNVVVDKDKINGLVTIGIGPNETKSSYKYHSCWMYITFKNKLLFQSTVFDSTGRDFIDGGEYGNYTSEQIQEMTKDTIDNLQNLLSHKQ